MNKTKITLVSIAILALTAFAIYAIWLINQPIPLQIQGEVEATQIKVSSKLIGRIDSIAVHKGDYVKTGDFLYRISSPELEAKLLQASAVKRAAQAQSSKATNGARKEDIQAAYNTMKKAEAAADYAKKSYQRVLNLYNEGVLPEQKKDEVETQMTAASETAKAARAIYEKALSGARTEDKAAAHALVDQADGVLSEVNSYLTERDIYATRNAEVSNIIAELGELVPAGYPVVTLVDLKDIWVTFYLKESLLSDIKKGDIIKATFPALGMKSIELRVSYIAVMGDFATYNATKTSGDFDMRSFEIHAVPTDKTIQLLPGMTALVNWDAVRQNS